MNYIGTGLALLLNAIIINEVAKTYRERWLYIAGLAVAAIQVTIILH